MFRQLIILYFLFCSCFATNTQSFYEEMGKNVQAWRYLDEEAKKQLIFFEEQFIQTLGSKKVAKGIPKKVHLIWIGTKNFPIESLETVYSWVKQHPDWEFNFWTDRERLPPIANFTVRSISDLDLASVKVFYEQSQNFAEKADLLRYVILESEGGIYIDHDILCLRSFEDLIHEYDFFIGLEVPHEKIDGLTITVGNAIIGTIAHHPIIQEILEQIKVNWQRVTEQFSIDDSELMKYKLVMHRTYVHATHVIHKMAGKTATKDIILPAAYFFPVENMAGVYSKHLFANSWYFYGDYKKQGQQMQSIYQLVDHITLLWRVSLVIVILSSSVLIYQNVWRKQ